MGTNGNLERRRCALTDNLCMQLCVLEKRYGVKQNDIIKIAVCHGIQKLKNGYWPYRNLNIAKWRKITGKQKEIYLPAETWAELDKLVETKKEYLKKKKEDLKKKKEYLETEKEHLKIEKEYLKTEEDFLKTEKEYSKRMEEYSKRMEEYSKRMEEYLETSIPYESEDHIPYGELIEMFIRLEIKGLSAFLEKVEPYYKEWEDRSIEENINNIPGDVDDLFKKETMTVNVTVPAVFKRKFEKIQKDTGLDGDTIGNYLMLQSMFHEYCYCDFTTVDRDADIIPLIEANKLEKEKFYVLNIIRILMLSNKLIFMDDKSLEYLRKDFEEPPEKMGNGKIESPKNS